MRKLNDNASIDMLIVVILAAIAFSLSIPVVYSVIGSIDTTSIDQGFNETFAQTPGGIGPVYNSTTSQPAGNATDSILDNLATFYDIGPIYLIVVAAVAIVAAVMLLRGRQ